MLVVNPSVPANSLEELVQLVKSNPEKYIYASQGVGSNGHVTAELFFQRAAIKPLQHVPYRGSAPAVNDLLAGNVHLMFDNLPSVLELIRAGKLRALAVTSRSRSELLPETPTVAERGFDGFETTAWFAVAVSKQTPEAIRTRIEQDVIAAIRSPDVTKRLQAAGVQAVANGSREIETIVSKETEVWRDVVSRAGISVD